MELIDEGAFEKDGGLTIGIGLDHHLYTLRTEYWDMFYQKDEFGGAVGTPIRRSHHVRNLGKDWAEVAERLPAILLEAGYPENVRVHVPGYAQGKLDPNNKPAEKFIPTDMIPFGKYEGKRIGEVMESDPNYLFFLTENYSPANESQRGRWMAFLRDSLAPQLAERAHARELERTARESRAAESRKRLAPLIEVLRGQSRAEGDFCSSIAKDLEKGSAIEDLAPRAQEIVLSIWARSTGGRQGSKKYDAAVAEFEERFLAPLEQPEPTSPDPVDSAIAKLTSLTHGQKSPDIS